MGQSLHLMMRRNACLLLIVALAAALLWPTAAQAKGSHLRFVQEQYGPGDHAVAHAEVETWKGSGHPEDAPYRVYLVHGRQPLHFGHLPNDAIQVGELKIGVQLASDTYRVKVAFQVPSVPDGSYAVWVCGARSGGTGCWLGFGDLVYGQIVVARGTEPGTTAAPDELTATPTARRSSPRTVFPLLVIALAGLAAAGLGAVYVRRRHRRIASA